MLSKMRFIVFLLVLAVPALGHEKVEAAANDGLEEKWGADVYPSLINHCSPVTTDVCGLII